MSDTPRVDAFMVEYNTPPYSANPTETVWELARQLERELAEAKKDAERYRWLRANGPLCNSSLANDACKYRGTGPGLNAAIDEAMK